jgi:hypothetical protein
MRIAPAIAGRRDVRNEHGAILVHVAVALAGLTAFSVLVVDLGAVWVARRQAQNAADASALSAAVTLAYFNPSDTAGATAAAGAVAGAHAVWGEPVALGSGQVNYISCPPGLDPLPAQCVRVDLGGGPALPVYFAGLLGTAATTVSATATATVVGANATTCLAPWAIVDRWTDSRDVDAPIDVNTFTPEDRYEAYLPAPPITPLPLPRDVYVPPSSSGSGTGYTVSSHLGLQIQVDLIDPDAIPMISVRGNWFVALDLTNSAGSFGEEAYVTNIASCRNVEFVVGDTVVPELYSAAATASGVDALIARDPGAYWNGTSVQGSAHPVSPRIVPIALLNPDFIAQLIVQPPPEAPPLEVVNVIGLFVESFIGNTLQGVIVPMAGNYDTSRPRLTEDSAFLRAITLVR